MDIAIQYMKRYPGERVWPNTLLQRPINGAEATKLNCCHVYEHL